MNVSQTDRAIPTKPDSEIRKRRWPDYGTIWRWHFYAGMFCIPFVLILAVTGTIFLFRPQIEAWEERVLDQLDGDQQSVAYADQVRAAQREATGWLASLEVASEPATRPGHASATRIIVESDGQRLRSYVNPATGEVLRVINESDRFIRWIRQIHGELLLGPRGSYVVELAASWTIIMVITGLVLWMPKGVRVAGVLFPRLNGTGKLFWKDLHSVIGFWSAGFILFLIATGLPWSTFWGDYFKSIRRSTGTAVARQSWEGGHAGHDKKKVSRQPAWRAGAVDPASYDLREIDVVASYAKQLDWLPPVEINPPSDGTSVWTIQSTTANRPYRQTIKFDAQQETLVSHQTFSDKHWVDRMVGQGIALHEGQRFNHTSFGWLNQAFALFATASLVTISCSGLMLWWRRRTPDVPGAAVVGLNPPAKQRSIESVTISTTRLIAFGSVAIALAIYLPLFGLSLVGVLIGDQIVMRVCPPASRWLGRRSPSQSMSPPK